ncbi:acetyl-coenzyme A synthetase N-terminal domain-containing protein, partial [Leucobacter soli]
MSGLDADAGEAEARLTETRSFPPPAAFAAQANVDASVYGIAAQDPIAFWERAAERLDWEQRWHTAHTWEPPRPTPGEHGEPGGLSVPQATWFA